MVDFVLVPIVVGCGSARRFLDYFRLLSVWLGVANFFSPPQKCSIDLVDGGHSIERKRPLAAWMVRSFSCVRFLFQYLPLKKCTNVFVSFRCWLFVSRTLLTSNTYWIRMFGLWGFAFVVSLAMVHRRLCGDYALVAVHLIKRISKHNKIQTALSFDSQLRVFSVWRMSFARAT